MPLAIEFKAGLKLHYRSTQWVVADPAFEDGQLRLRDPFGRVELVDLVDLHAADDFIPIIPEKDARRFDPRSVILDTYPEILVRDALDLEAHIHEYETGFASGREDLPRPGEPREAYNPALVPVMQRRENKARELVLKAHPDATGEKLDRLVRKEVERLRKLARNYREVGLIALVNLRKVPRRNPLGHNPPQVVDAARKVSAAHINRSNVTRVNLALAVKREAEKLNDGVPLARPPSNRSVQRLLRVVGKAKHLFGAAPTRRSLDNRPKHMYQGVLSTRPGEYVLFDLTPGDFFCLHPLDPGVVQRCKCLVGMDLYSRSIVTARLVPAGRAIDLSFAFHDVITPKRMLPGWPSRARYPYVGVPEHVVLRVYHLPEGTDLAAIPWVLPDTVVVDNGWIFTSRHMRNICKLLGVTILYARPYTPTDKPQIERWFRTFAQTFCQSIPGYIGSNVQQRGKNPEEDAVYFPHEVEARIGEWLATHYHFRPHGGLKHPDYPKVLLSPNDLFEVGLRTAGLLVAPLGQDIYYQLLEALPARIIHDYGVEYMGLYYDHPDLGPFRNQLSQDTHLKHRWIFRRDPRDLRYLYFQNPRTGAWVRLERKPTAFPHAQFTDELLQQAKDVAFKKTGHVRSPEEVSAALDSLVRGIQAEVPKLKQRRRELQRMQEVLRSEQDREDVLGEPVTPPPPPPPAPTLSKRPFTPVGDIPRDITDLYDFSDDDE
ncbi:hypothetical protein DAERI_010053 [Deinococcus aerius]|uniref:Integrase catalytic domain-containing protein n=1 Tax=Deinococcus aerius TaxID=200253 RepID=A0A2I9DGY1_9DEIO|nr:DDE-type integrase/transposase/recombinase [Deinococcus aerius]GBF03881.1 hypothetical protein DAERI_010053 [Deinococcus aerius]